MLNVIKPKANLAPTYSNLSKTYRTLCEAVLAPSKRLFNLLSLYETSIKTVQNKSDKSNTNEW